MTARLIAGVDVGGTFTDVVLFDSDARTLSVTKVPSTPADQSDGVRSGLLVVLQDLDRLDKLVHGTTVSTNTMLQASGARVAMVTTRGFRDVLEIGRTRRMLPSLYDPTFTRPPPLVPRTLRFEVSERLAADGSMLAALDEDALADIARTVRDAKAESVAICFLHAHVNAAHEARAKEVLQRALPGVWITTSAEVVPEFREYERFSTTVINAYLLPVMDRYMSSLSAKLGDAGYRGDVFTMSSGGGIMDLAAARSMPVRTILSGPAGGVAGALWIAKTADLRNFITCDMGGTSTDVCLIENLQAASVSETAFAGYPIKGRAVAINTVGAGGGSIAYIEAGHTLRVGPRSAGADPGPACYGRGGNEPTVTDANVVLGRLGTRLLGGAIRPDVERARAAVAALGTPPGDSEHRRDGRGHRAHRRGADGECHPRDFDRARLRSFRIRAHALRRRWSHARRADRRRNRHWRDPGAHPARQPVGVGPARVRSALRTRRNLQDATLDARSRRVRGGAGSARARRKCGTRAARFQCRFHALSARARHALHSPGIRADRRAA